MNTVDNPHNCPAWCATDHSTDRLTEIENIRTHQLAILDSPDEDLRVDVCSADIPDEGRSVPALVCVRGCELDAAQAVQVMVALYKAWQVIAAPEEKAQLAEDVEYFNVVFDTAFAAGMAEAREQAEARRG